MSVILAFGNVARNARNAGTEQSKSPSCNARKIAIVRGYVTERADDIERTDFGLDSEETATREVTSGVLFEIVWSDDRLRSLLDCRA